MNDFRLPPVVVDYNQLWVSVDLRGDVSAWSERACDDLVARKHWAGFRSRRGKRQVIALLEQAAELARRAPDASMAYLLIPSPQDGVKATVHFSPVDLAGLEGDEAWESLLSELAPELPGDYPPEIATIASKAGECRRMRLRYAAGHGPERPVGEHNGYLWVFEEYGAAVLMATSFVSLLEAARWHPALDELASDVWLQRSEETTDNDSCRR